LDGDAMSSDMPKSAIPMAIVARMMRGSRRAPSRSRRSHPRRRRIAPSSVAPTQPEMAMAAATPTWP